MVITESQKIIVKEIVAQYKKAFRDLEQIDIELQRLTDKRNHIKALTTLIKQSEEAILNSIKTMNPDLKEIDILQLIKIFEP